MRASEGPPKGLHPSTPHRTTATRSRPSHPHAAHARPGGPRRASTPARPAGTAATRSRPSTPHTKPHAAHIAPRRPSRPSPQHAPQDHRHPPLGPANPRTKPHTAPPASGNSPKVFTPAHSTGPPTPAPQPDEPARLPPPGVRTHTRRAGARKAQAAVPGRRQGAMSTPPQYPPGRTPARWRPRTPSKPRPRRAHRAVLGDRPRRRGVGIRGAGVGGESA